MVVAVAVLAAAAPAAAHPQATACNLLSDATGDVMPAAGTDDVPVQDARDPQLDIVSADIAADSKNVTAVIRLKTLAAPDPNDPNGFMYTFYFTAQEQTFWLSAAYFIGGSNYGAWAEDGRHEAGGTASASSGSLVGEATGSVDLRRREIRITASRTVFESRAHLAAGTSLYDLAAWSWRGNGVAPSGSIAGVAESADVADKPKASYRVGQRSCIQ
jgi:hypothetical protein